MHTMNAHACSAYMHVLGMHRNLVLGLPVGPSQGLSPPGNVYRILGQLLSRLGGCGWLAVAIILFDDPI